MFKSDFLEFFSKVHFTVPLIIFVPVVSYFTYRSLMVQGHSLLFFLGFFLSGLLVWTATEYFLHRFVFHYKPTSKVGKQLHFIMHGVHHDYPNDSHRLVMPPILSIPLAFLFYYTFRLLLGETNIAPFFTGFVIGYLLYDMTHYAVHHFRLKGKVWSAIKNHHMRHHYQEPERGYGVSSPLWDYLMDTKFRFSKKSSQNRKESRVSERDNVLERSG